MFVTAARKAAALTMTHKLTDSEWDELVDLITSAPAARMGEALRRLVAADRQGTPAAPADPTSANRTTEDWLLHLASISSGEAFDRALLTELRRLSIH
jgi:uncharacterized protein with von Willebrand factor type A (vWA) domain